MEITEWDSKKIIILTTVRGIRKEGVRKNKSSLGLLRKHSFFFLLC